MKEILEQMDDPILVHEIDQIICNASLNACSKEDQKYLIDNYDQLKNRFTNKIESNGQQILTVTCLLILKLIFHGPL